VGLASLALWPQSPESVDAVFAQLDPETSGGTPHSSVVAPSPSPAPAEVTVGASPAPAAATIAPQRGDEPAKVDKGGNWGKDGGRATVIPPVTTAPSTTPQPAPGQANRDQNGRSSDDSGEVPRRGSGNGHSSHSKNSSPKPEHPADGQGRGAQGNGSSTGSKENGHEPEAGD
jgi:NADH-quinone oxidoreductase subunit C